MKTVLRKIKRNLYFHVQQICQANTSKISRHAIAVSPLLSSMPETATPYTPACFSGSRSSAVMPPMA